MPGDARLIRESLADLSGNMFDLETADRLASALRRISAGGIDAILLDLALPDSKGRETFSKTKAHAATDSHYRLDGIGGRGVGP